MSLLDKITQLFNTNGHISQIDAEFDKHDSNLPVGIKMHYAGRDGIDEDRLVIREYQNGTVGRKLIYIEFDEVSNTWVFRDANTQNKFTTISGEENYHDVAKTIENKLEKMCQ